MIIHHLFPEALYFSNLERKLTKGELKTINKQKTYKNAGNTTSNDNYVLEDKTLNNLKKDLHTKVMDYFDKVICTDNLITPYITQSWVNYTKRDQFHHKHDHPNSLVSGIFYVSANKKVDSVTFSKKLHQDDRIKLDITKYNVFNSSNCTFPVETGNVLLFRSSLPHAVKIKEGNNIRISLSFNVFFKGTIGNKKELTELIFE